MDQDTQYRFCPVCQSWNIDCCDTTIKHDLSEIRRHMYCDECGYHWIMVYGPPNYEIDPEEEVSQ